MRIGVLGEPSGDAGPALTRAVRMLGAELGRRCWGLVSGAPGPVRVDLASTAVVGGVEPIEVLPGGAEAQPSCEPRRVGSPGERASLVHQLSDAVLVLPGGVDVVAVLLDLLSRQALELGSKPCAVLDPTGLLDPLVAQLAALEQAGELSAPLLREADPGRLADRVAAWRPAGQDAVRDEVAWMRIDKGSLLLLPQPDGAALPGGTREPDHSGRVALSQWLAEHCSLHLRPERFQLVTALAISCAGGVLRRVTSPTRCCRDPADADVESNPCRTTGCLRSPSSSVSVTTPSAGGWTQER